MRAIIAFLLLATYLWAFQDYVELTWTASTTPDVTYNIYRSRKNDGPYNLLKSGVACCETNDRTVRAGDTYYYVAKAVNSSGEESVYSNQVEATIP